MSRIAQAPLLGLDLVLADLEHDVRQARPLGVELDREAEIAQARVGLVVADDQVAARLQRLRGPVADRRWSPRHRTPICQGRSSPFMRGVKLCTAITAGTTPCAAELADPPGDGAVVGQEVADHAVDHGREVEPLVAGTTQPSLISGIEVGVPGRRLGSITSRDMWFRIAGASSSRARRAGQVGGADVPADMAGQRLVARRRADRARRAPAGRHGRTGGALALARRY